MRTVDSTSSNFANSGRENMPCTLTLTLKRDFIAFEVLIPAVGRYLEENKVSAEASYKVNLVIEEIVLNLIRHATDAVSDEIQIHLEAEPEALRIVIEDDSKPFDPRGLSKPKRDLPLAEWSTGGMGLHLVRSMVDRLEYERRDGKNRLEVQIVAWSKTSDNP